MGQWLEEGKVDVLIVYGNNLAHRCRHVYYLSYQGVDTSVRFGLLRVLTSTVARLKISDYAPEIVVVCWDGGPPQYRYDRCPTYKKRDRSDDPDYDVFLEQLVELRLILGEAFGVVSVQHSGIEADDLMYHAANMLDVGGHKIIYTGDKDLYQAVVNDPSGQTVVLDTKANLITRDNFTEFSDGIPMEQWMDYRAMVGDSSDGYPGIHGVGPKTAAKLLTTYKTHTGIVNAANDRGDPNLPQMSSSVASKERQFGFKGFQDGFATMRLDIDRCGAKRVLLEAFNSWKPCDINAVRQYIRKYMMISLMEDGSYRAFDGLQSPLEYMAEGLRMPVVPIAKRVDV